MTGPARAVCDPVTFINALTHAKGIPHAGQPFTLRDWQRDIVTRLFTRRPDGRLQYRTCLLMLPRKNGKTELAAAVALYGLLGAGEIGAEVYSAAADKEQAGLVFGVAAQMVRNDPVLRTAVEIVDSQKRIIHRASGSFYRAISAEAYSKHGFNASMVVYDELHAAPDRELYDVLSTSMGARTDPVMFVISTAGYDRHSILWELYTHGKRVLEDPTIDPTFLPILYEATADADWTDEAVWAACNPALNDFRDLEEMRAAAHRARSLPAQQNTFRRLYLNQWTEQDERWLDLALWDRNAGHVDPEALAGQSCFAGLDLASTRDVTAFVLLFGDGDGGYLVVPRFWIPANSLTDRIAKDRVPYDVWVQQGWMQVTDGDVCDYDRIREDIKALSATYDIREIAYDRWGATQLVTQLQADGATCVPMGQGFASLSPPTKELEKLLLGDHLHHGDHPVLRWMAGNVAVEQDAAGNLKPSKRKSHEKIDGIVALIMAIDRASRHAAHGLITTLDEAGVTIL